MTKEEFAAKDDRGLPEKGESLTAHYKDYGELPGTGS